MREGMPCKFSKDESGESFFASHFIRFLPAATIATCTHLIKSSVRRSSACWSRTAYYKWTREVHMVSIPPDYRAAHLVNRLMVSFRLGELLHNVRSISVVWHGLCYDIYCTTAWDNTLTCTRWFCTDNTLNLLTSHPGKTAIFTLTLSYGQTDNHIKYTNAKSDTPDTPVQAQSSSHTYKHSFCSQGEFVVFFFFLSLFHTHTPACRGISCWNTIGFVLFIGSSSCPQCQLVGGVSM